MPHAVDHHAILDRLAATRGGMRNAFVDLDPARTAHLVVDMQNGFMEPGAPVEVPEARGIVGNVNAISRALRDAGGTNVFLRYTTSDLNGSWSVFGRRMGPVATAAHMAAFMPDAHHHDFWPGLDVQSGDVVIDKSRFSAFTGQSALHDELQARGIDTLVITGTLTNCCCETNARDAMQMNYRVIMVPDANAALSDDEHAATLHTLAMVFADLCDTAEVLAQLKKPDTA
ncbi:MAG: isochorismatase family cysteine hydrolase [Croceibacterium sp.]